jgi:RNA polymerase sigma-70 factor (ECF subfamily)
VFGKLYERHVDAVHRYLQVRTGTADAADLTQQVFLRVFASSAKYQTPESLGRHLGEVVKAFHPSPRGRISG